jgi:hypothetical protein
VTLFVRPLAGRPARFIITTALALLAVVPSASADTLRVTVDRALIWNRPSGVSVVLTQVTRGDILDVVRHLDEWYEIVLPRNLRIGQRTGFIRASQVEIDQVGPPSEEAQAILAGQPPDREPRSAPQRPGTARTPAARAARPRNSFLHLNAGYRVGGDDFIRNADAFTERYAETGSIDTNYGNGKGLQFDILGGSRVGRQFGVGVDVSLYFRPDGPSVTGHVPHPFYLNQLRDASFEDEDLTGSEIGIHVPFMWMPPPSTGKLSVSLFAGPSFFRLTQDVVTDLKVDEQYPYDTVTITDTVSERLHGNAFGFHVGGDVSYFFSPGLGAGVTGRFSRAAIKFSDDFDNVTTSGHAGGGAISGGLRFRF